MRPSFASLRRLVKRTLGAGRPRPAILMYHSIGTPLVDPWEIAVSPEAFEAQIDALRSRRSPMRLGEFVDRMLDDTLPDDAVAVTFDDGYLDNLRVAAPCLARHGVPATIFLATGYVGRSGEFWWDEIARILLTCRRHVDEVIELGDGQPYRLTLVPDERAGAGSSWRASEAARTDRQKSYLALWRRLRDMPDGAMVEAMRRLRQAVGAEPPAEGAGPMSAGEIAQMARESVIDVGAHTVSHPPLTILAPDACRVEIASSKAECERLLGRPVVGFSYPHGEFDVRTKEIVEESGFAWACSAQDDAIGDGDIDPFELPRIQALNWSGEELLRALRS